MLCGGLTVFSPLKRNGAGPGKKVGIVGIGGLVSICTYLILFDHLRACVAHLDFEYLGSLRHHVR